MGEQDALNALGVLGEWIWGNDLETIVFAQAFGHEKTLIFRFSRDNPQRSQSLTTRIVNCYHDLTVDSTSATFPNRLSMRVAIWSAVATVWAECSDKPTVEDPDVVIDVYDLGSTDLFSRITWSICHEDLFNDYIDLLLPPSQLSVKQPMDTVDFKSLIRLNQLGGRGCTTPVFTPSDPLSQFVFKGIDFRTFLNSYESGHIHEEVKIYYRSTELTAAAVAHTHFVAHTYHMDIKPRNLLLDADLNLVLIDWEQSDAPVTTAAPEIDSTWDVEEIPAEGLTTTLRYSKYTGQERRNMPVTTPGDNGWNVWNVFLVWSKQCPKALELAEVFSLGRCMWMLLRQPDMTAFNSIMSTEEVVEDWESSEDIPAHWKRTVQDCLKHDPNERIGLRELVAFWDNARHEVNEF
ncbi:MAG: hypothetical protein M4579_007326 [Chaenotheca gracillima]|nr:MAG: hypothetical protein M4579_007326 [Chaenotheca gracillima]